MEQELNVEKELKSYFDGGLAQMIGYNILAGLLTLITLGIYGLWLKIKMKKWIVKHTHF